MPQLERHTFYIPDSYVKEARERGMTNLSKFVREALKEYIDTGDVSGKTAPGSTSQGGQENVSG